MTTRIQDKRFEVYENELAAPESKTQYFLTLQFDEKTVALQLEDEPRKLPVAYQLAKPTKIDASAKLWDSGAVTFADPPEESMRRGCLKFELTGEKLKGGYILIRTTSPDRKPEHAKAWRLRKLEDAHAVPGVSESVSSGAIWPRTRFQKEELSDYYARMAPFLTKYFDERPYTVLRAPAGVAGGLFFENNPDSRLRHVEDFRQLGLLPAVELHAANYRADLPNLPDWIVLDFDPPTSGNDRELLDVARAANEFLEEMRLRFLWKLSGHRGLHLLIPLKRSYETVVVFDIAKMFAEMIHERVPTLSTIKVPTHMHGGRVLIDYHRNHYHQTIVAPFSPRATLRPVVSLPVEWSMLREANALPVFEIDMPDHVLSNAAKLLQAALAKPNDLEPAFVAMERMVREAL